MPAGQAPFCILAAQATFDIWDKVTVVYRVSQTVRLRSPDRSRHPVSSNNENGHVVVQKAPLVQPTVYSLSLLLDLPSQHLQLISSQVQSDVLVCCPGMQVS